MTGRGRQGAARTGSLFAGAAAVARSLPSLRGRGRMALALHRRAPRFDTSWDVEMRAGHRMTVPAGSAQTWRAAFTGAYDDEELELLLPHVAPGSFVLDVGASLGFYAVPLGLAAGRAGGRVLAIEPVPANCAVIRRNLAANGLESVVDIVVVGLGAREESVLLHVETGGTGNATIVSGLDPGEVAGHDRAGGTGDVEMAQVVRLDDLALPEAYDGLRCSLMKIDAEGFEMDALAGGTAFVTAHRPVIFAEFHPSWLATRGVAPAAPQAWAAANDYDVSELVYTRAHPVLDRRRITLRPLTARATRSGTSLLLVPRGG